MKHGEVNLASIPFVLLFEVIGIKLIISGAKTIIKDKKTDKYGISTYGVIKDILETGSYVNGIPELKAEILVYLPYENTTKVFYEIIGLAPEKYNIGEFVLLSHYEDDVNIVETTEPKFIPSDILEKLNIPLENDAPRIIEIGNYKYIRKDLIGSLDSFNTQNKTDI